MLFIYFYLIKSLKIPTVILSQTISQPGNACFQLLNVPVIFSVIIIPLKSKGTLNTQNILIQQQNLISHCDNMTV